MNRRKIRTFSCTYQQRSLAQSSLNLHFLIEEEKKHLSEVSEKKVSQQQFGTPGKESAFPEGLSRDEKKKNVVQHKNHAIAYYEGKHFLCLCSVGDSPPPPPLVAAIKH